MDSLSVQVSAKSSQSADNIADREIWAGRDNVFLAQIAIIRLSFHPGVQLSLTLLTRTTRNRAFVSKTISADGSFGVNMLNPLITSRYGRRCCVPAMAKRRIQRLVGVRNGSKRLYVSGLGAYVSIIVLILERARNGSFSFHVGRYCKCVIIVHNDTCIITV